MKKLTNQKKIGIVVLLLLVAWIIAGPFLFSIYDSGYTNNDGIVCNYDAKTCGESRFLEGYGRITNRQVLCTESGWRDVDNEAYHQFALRGMTSNDFNNKTCHLEFNSEIGKLDFYGRTSYVEYPERSTCNGGSDALQCILTNYVIANSTRLMTEDEITTFTQGGVRRFDFGYQGNLAQIKWDFSTSEFPVINPPGCTPNWQCTQWSNCVNNVQTRTCNDLNNCGQSNPNPTSQSCTTFCVPGSYQCLGNNYQRCNTNGLSYNTIQSCISPQICEVGHNGCYTSNCTPECPSSTNFNCGQNIPSNNNCGSCGTGTYCSSGTCQSGTCVNNNCGDGTCNNGETSSTCSEDCGTNPDGNWYDFLFKVVFTLGTFQITWLYLIIGAVALFLIIK
jgi:hypothetical protein